MNENKIYSIGLLILLIIGVFYFNKYEIEFSDSTENEFYMPENIGEERFYTGKNIRLFTHVGKKINSKIKSNGKNGTLIFGPYIYVESGKYNIIYEYEIEKNDGILENTFADIVSSTSKEIAKQEINKDENNVEFRNIEFNKDENVEFRIFVDENCKMTFKKIIIRRIE